ncbi:MAG: peptidoglycan-associated lipoprotein Pal [Alphaproteobacteria bacterium]|nr:peptidoglycan-associated lipoprotein Pal [Alphaproteobacteria bacterium]
MRFKLTTLIAAAFLVTACEAPTDETATAGSGGASSASTSSTVTSTTQPAQPSIVPGTQEDLVVNIGDRVFFAFDKSNLTAESRATLEKQAAWLTQHPQVTVIIEGHADERGTREYNIALGDRRATSARDYLISLGVDAGRITTISYGKERPAVAGSNEEAWGQNRRAVSVVN